jgi:hypothetical protein
MWTKGFIYFYEAFFIWGDILKKFRLFVITSVAIGTLLSIFYLIYVAKQMEMYTLSRNDGNPSFILYSSGGGSFKNMKDEQNILKHTEKILESSGYDALALSIPGYNENIARDSIIKNMKKNKKYIILDISPTKLLVSNKAFIVRIGNKDNPKYDENMEYGRFIKENINDKELKVNLLTDLRSNYNQDIGYKSIRIEIAESLSESYAQAVLSKIAAVLIK